MNIDIDLPMRMLICGSAGTGKTNQMCFSVMKFLRSNTFTKVYIVTTHRDEPLNCHLTRCFPDAIVITDTMPVITDATSLVVFDTPNWLPRWTIESYFARAYKENLSMIYIVQSYSLQVPKNIRKHATHKIFFGSFSKRDRELRAFECGAQNSIEIVVDSPW